MGDPDGSVTLWKLRLRWIQEGCVLPGKAPLLMRPRGTGRAVDGKDSLSLIRGCSCHQEGKVTGPEQAPAREGCGAASDAVRQVLARRRNTVGTTPAGRCNERTDRSVQCCHCRGFHSLTRQVAGSGGLLRAASDAPAAAGCTKGADRAAPDVADAMCEDPYGYPLVPRGDADDCTRTALQRTAKGLYTQKPVNPAETT
ncbi:hypothetical protein NtRootA1_30220 [Arthrobacter sp. NtRootA1]|nr:hypothetical protein NtRootA1_30220 [Arthrobacter sp. NtRootA1]